jgi:hypothetical protein
VGIVPTMSAPDGGLDGQTNDHFAARVGDCSASDLADHVTGIEPVGVSMVAFVSSCHRLRLYLAGDAE